MTDNVVNLTERLAMEDCRRWSVADCLRAVLADIEQGRRSPTILYVAMVEPGDEDEPDNYPYRCAGGSALEIAGLLGVHHALALRDAATLV
jgi:hypothetical protein